MRNHAAALAALVLSGLVGVLQADEPRRATASMAREAAEENAKTPAGRRYQSALDSSLDAWLRKSLERCVKGISKEQAISFNAYVQIGEKGLGRRRPLRARDGRRRLRRARLSRRQVPSPPPEPAWWVRIDVQLK